MKQSKQSQLIHIWEDYEFYLSIPKTFTGSNKPHVYYYYLDVKTTKSTWIRKHIGKNDGNIKLIKDEAKKLHDKTYPAPFPLISRCHFEKVKSCGIDQILPGCFFHSSVL